jgi:phosphomannomutase
MKVSLGTAVRQKELVVFDLDGTLAPSKSPMDDEMVGLFTALLAQKKVAVIGGGKYQLFQEQMINQLPKKDPNLSRLFLFPTTSTAFYRYSKKRWQKVYAHVLTAAQVKKIKHTFHKVFEEIGYKHPKKVYGELIENRGTQVSFSVYGQDIVAVLGARGRAMKERWKEKHTPTKMRIAERMAMYLPECEVRAAGHTTIDVTQKGIDKAYGLLQIKKYVRVPLEDMLFVGDSIFPGGNDYAVTTTVVDYMPVSSPEDTKRIIRYILKQQ